MPDAAVTLDCLQSFEIQSDFASQIAFDDVFAFLNRVGDLRQLLFVQILGADNGVDVGLPQDFLRIHRADPIDVAQGDVDAFFTANIYSEQAWHISVPNLDVVCGARWCKSRE